MRIRYATIWASILGGLSLAMVFAVTLWISKIRGGREPEIGWVGGYIFFLVIFLGFFALAAFFTYWFIRLRFVRVILPNWIAYFVSVLFFSVVGGIFAMMGQGKIGSGLSTSVLLLLPGAIFVWLARIGVNY